MGDRKEDFGRIAEFDALFLRETTSVNHYTYRFARRAEAEGLVVHLERRGNIWGLGADLRQKFVQSAGVEIIDAARHEYLVSLGCAGAFEADFQKSLRSLFDILRAGGVSFGVLAKERCTGDVAKRTGNEYEFQELARGNIGDFTAAGVTKIVTSCPHCLRTMGADYREFGLSADVIHSASLVEDLTRTMAVPGAGAVTLHEPCYLGRYAGVTEDPRALLARFGAAVHEAERHGANPFCLDDSADIGQLFIFLHLVTFD